MPNTQNNDGDVDYKVTDVPEPEIILNPKVDKAEKIPKPEIGRALLRIEQKRVESPFIPPDYLEAYERILPGVGEKLMDAIIQNQLFQMEVKRSEIDLTDKKITEAVKVNDANIREQDALNLARSREIDIKSRGQIFAFIISILILCAAILFAILGHIIIAGACVGIMVAMASVLFLQKTPTHEKAAAEGESPAEATKPDTP